eukprot:scaffold2990_cov239-Pinguiococcus_pyrenoidosus.AAC.9
MDPHRSLCPQCEKPKYNQTAADLAMKSLRERYATATDKPKGSTAQEGDSLVVNMQGHAYDETAPNNKGAIIQGLAEGSGIDLIMEKDRFMPGLVEALVGAAPGDVRD